MLWGKYVLSITTINLNDKRIYYWPRKFLCRNTVIHCEMYFPGMCTQMNMYHFLNVTAMFHVSLSTSVSRRYIGALGARVICDNIPGLVNKQRQLCQRHPDIMQSIGEGAKEWIRECQHQFRHHRWNCSTLDRDHTVFGRVMLRSKSVILLEKKICLGGSMLCIPVS